MVVLREGPYAMHMVGQDDPGVDMEWEQSSCRFYGGAQIGDFRYEQRGTAIPQVDGEEVGAARDAVSSVIGHGNSIACGKTPVQRFPLRFRNTAKYVADGRDISKKDGLKCRVE